MIVTTREVKNGPVVGIAGAGGFVTINIHKYMMNREIGFEEKLCGSEEEAVPFEHIPSE